MRRGFYIAIVSCVLTSALVTWDLGIDLGDLSTSLESTIRTLRAYRVAGALLAGAALSVAGAVAQGLFRNPLASPSILGTTAGASLGGQVALLIPGLAAAIRPELLLPIGATVGATLSLALLLAILRRTGDLFLLLLSGFLFNSLFLAMGSLLLSLVQDEWTTGRAVIRFSLGSLAGVGFPQLAFSAPLIVFGVAASLLWTRPLDVLLSGEKEAASLGVDVQSLRFWCVVWVSVLVAAAISLSGTLAFVGLVVPHVIRSLGVLSHRALIPASAFFGGTFVLLCDLIARALSGVTEVPLGVMTALIGAPVFLLLLLRDRRLT